MRRRLKLERWPIALRVTGLFAATMAVVLVAAGLFVYLALRAELTDALDDTLRTRADATARLIAARGGAVRPGLTEGRDDPEETFTQVIAPGERLLSSTPGLPRRPIIGARRRAAATDPTTISLDGRILDHDAREALEEAGTEGLEGDRARVIARSVNAGGRRLSVVTGATFEERDEALSRLGRVLLIGAPVALLLTGLVGFGAVRGALRPVERMRRRAATISAGEPGARLPVAAADDELARLGHTLNEMLERLESALQRERTFVADASHELRTPLAILRGEIDVALAGSRSADALETALRSVAEEAERLTAIAEGLLLLARSDTGTLPLDREPLDPHDLLVAARDRFARRAAHLGRSISIQAPEGLVIEGDRQRLDQALSNLLDNALRHGDGDVELRAEPTDTALRLVVRDHGPGIPPAFAARAFERFSRADEGRTGSGTGLGLAIVQVIAAAHGGTAVLEAAPGGGLRAVLRLPAASR